MTEIATKQSAVTRIKNAVVKYERPILITTTAVSVTAAVLMRKGIAQHNEFLKEHGLYEQFYALATTPEV